MKLLYIFALSVLIVTTAAANSSTSDVPIPKTMRLPTCEETKDEWRDSDKQRYLSVRGDFNGDGIIDVAKILVIKDDLPLSLVAFISQPNGKFKTYILETIKDYRLIRAMGIKKVSPGSYVTACGKGYWTCRQDESQTIYIGTVAIDFFKTESANSFFYWDKNINNFKKIWISD